MPSSSAWPRYRDNLARHLIGIARDLQSRVVLRLSDCGYGDPRPSLAPLLSLVSSEARSLALIAEQLGTSKQACSQLVGIAEQAGYIERRPDPEDRRAKLVVLSPHGRALVEEAAAAIASGEQDYRQLVGAAPYQSFVSATAALFEGLQIPTHADPALYRNASRSAGALPLISLRIEQDLMDATARQGHRGLKLSHGQVLPLIGPDGARIHEIARVHGVSRQAISATSRDLEELGYLRRESDVSDRRGVVLQLTPTGTRLIEDSVRALDTVEAEFRSILGRRRLAHLSRVARELYRALHLEEEIFGAVAPTRKQGLEGLAVTLRQQLGSKDVAKLAALLGSDGRRSTT